MPVRLSGRGSVVDGNTIVSAARLLVDSTAWARTDCVAEGHFLTFVTPLPTVLFAASGGVRRHAVVSAFRMVMYTPCCARSSSRKRENSAFVAPVPIVLERHRGCDRELPSAIKVLPGD